MKTFREFVNEETMPFAQTEKGFVGIESPAVRDNINSLLAGVTDCEFLTPYIALERVAKVLANFHIFLPKQTFLDSDQGMVTIEINQFGEKVGMQDNGEVVTQASSPYYLYFEYEVDDNGTFEVFSEVVTEDELDEILSDMDEEELDEEKDSEEKDDEEDDEDEKEEKLDEACWEGYKQVGTKMKGGREVPNCVPLEEAVKKLVAKALKEAEGMHLDKPQKGKMASINKLNKEEKSGMPAWYEKEKSKSASLQAATKAKKKEQQKKTDYAIRNMKEEQLDELSKKTLGSYIRNAMHDVVDKGTELGRMGKYHGQGKLGRKTVRRMKSMAMATHKLVDTKEEKIDESKITHIVAKKDLSKHKKWMDSEGYDTHTKNLPKSHPKHETHVGIVSKSSVESSYHGDGHAEPIKEEQLDELSKKTLGSYIKKSSEDKAHARSDKTIANYNRDEKKKKEASDVIAKRSKGIDMAVNKLTKEENLDELSKATLGSYVKKASHDVAAKSAAVRGFARDADAQRKDKKPMDARKSDERADKMFKKSWNRRQGMAKAVDKLTKEELSPADKGRVAAGYRGSVSNPAKQGAIAAYLDDQERDKKKQQKAKTPEKANFNVAKKLARQAVKAQKAKNK